MTPGASFLRVTREAHVPSSAGTSASSAYHRCHSSGDRRRSRSQAACFRLVTHRWWSHRNRLLRGPSVRFASLHLLIAVDTAAFVVVFAWSSAVGLRLWRGDPRGTKWGIALYALQIPVLEIHGFKYQYFTGVAMLWLHNPAGSPVVFDFGADMALMFNGDSGDFILGVNIIAIAACAVIATSEHRKLWTMS